MRLVVRYEGTGFQYIHYYLHMRLLPILGPNGLEGPRTILVNMLFVCQMKVRYTGAPHTPGDGHERRGKVSASIPCHIHWEVVIGISKCYKKIEKAIN